MNEEEELKEELERYERQNQEAYDQEVSGEKELQRQEEKRIRKGEKRRYQRLKRKQVQTGGNTGEQFIPDKTGDFAPAPDRDMRTGEPIYNPETDQFGNPFEMRRAEYQINRDKLNASRNLDPSRFPNQVQTAKKTVGDFATKVVQDMSTPEGITEFTLDMFRDASILATSDLPTGLVTVAKLRFGKEFLDQLFKARRFRKTVTPEGLEMPAGLEKPMMMSENLGGFGKKANKKIFEIQQSMRPKANQMDLFANPSDYEMLELYKSQNKVVGQKRLPKRAQAGRALRPTDFDAITAEFPDITPDHIFGYIEQVKAAKLGRLEYKPSIKRRQFNQKGLEGTLRFLNQKAAYSPNFDLSEIAAELTAEFGLKGSKVITPKTIENLILDQGGISFRTKGMKKAVQINSIDDLREVYMDRLARYKKIPAFEKGHVFAVDNIIKDNRIANLSDFDKNLEPEIGRSIYRQLDDEAIEQLIKENANRNFDNIEDTYQSVLKGNRQRKNLDDPDKVLADLYGTQYGLRESFLSYVYPERSLGRLIPADLKAAFADLYKKELDMALLDYKGASVGPYALDQIKNRVAIQVLKSFGPDKRTKSILNRLVHMSDKAYGKDMVDYLTGEAF